MTTDDELRKLIALGEKATARPWSFYDAFDVVGNPGIVAANRLGTNDTTVIGACLHGYDEIHVIETDAAYLCAAANLAPEIAAELIAARGEIQRLRNKLERTNVLFRVEQAARLELEKRIESIRSQYDIWRDLNPEDA